MSECLIEELAWISIGVETLGRERLQPWLTEAGRRDGRQYRRVAELPDNRVRQLAAAIQNRLKSP